ncbi:hypothetical protein WJX72_004927 [[Myrmecia] bisecta]|uniref:Uncharacterized protein n=1 Tax=[Myrmecia] bisecta TaxID=41462 RepID=A0AAW1QFJ8_9CHLO
MPQLSRVHASGPGLAALLNSLATATNDFDGILLGHLERRVVATLHDTKGEECNEELYPDNPPSLALYAMMSRHVAHHGATSSFQQRYFQLAQPLSRAASHQAEGALTPLRLVISNLGDQQLQHSYRHAYHAAPLPLVPSLFPRSFPKDTCSDEPARSSVKKDRLPSILGHSTEAAPAALQSLAVDDLRRQVQGVEDVFAQLIDQVAAAAHLVSKGSEPVAAVHAEVQALYQQLDWDAS